MGSAGVAKAHLELIYGCEACLNRRAQHGSYMADPLLQQVEVLQLKHVKEAMKNKSYACRLTHTHIGVNGVRAQHSSFTRKLRPQEATFRFSSRRGVWSQHFSLLQPHFRWG